MPRFLLQFQGAVIKEIPITKSELTVGRSPDNDIIIDNPAVSGHQPFLSRISIPAMACSLMQRRS